MKKLTIREILLNAGALKAGEPVLLSGTVYTARDAAHKRISDLLNKGAKPPFELRGAAIYYCGPAPAKPGTIIGACGPTTSARMDAFTPQMLENGVKILIGKGPRSKEVSDSIVKNNAVYFIATGGAAALLSKTVIKAGICAFKDLGPEAVYKLEVKDMPLITAIDACGNDIFNRQANNDQND
ncbi:MAG: FumA C-terminus/TtdB family hydratase beta subunit [Endomicrobium sp.]|jgi:fumarate hydratase subunit beta|nr:FumA C-terminus/TtdB family hydratase beta subunit [Endomicrobium sp.]